MIGLHLPDPQAPFQHPKYVDFIWKLTKKHKPDFFVHQGDGLDFKYLKYASVNDPETGEQQHIRTLTFYSQLYDIIPKCIVLDSNHDDRHYKTAEKAGIPKFHLKTLSELISAPKGWTWVDRYETPLMVCEHGHRFGMVNGLDGLSRKAFEKNVKSTVVGHFASLLGVKYVPSWFGTRFFMSVGCLIDINSYGMKFLHEFHIPPAMGAGVSFDGKKAIIERFEE